MSHTRLQFSSQSGAFKKHAQPVGTFFTCTVLTAAFIKVNKKYENKNSGTVCTLLQKRVSANKRINNFTRVTFNFGITTLLRLTQFSELGECRGVLWPYCTGHAYREKQEKKNKHCTMIPNCLIISRARSSTHVTSDINSK